MSLRNAYFLILLIILADQFSKIYIKTNFVLGEEVPVFSWFRIYFIENDGMAWGTKIPGEYGKLILTLFRIVVVSGIAWWLAKSVRENAPKLLIISISLIFAGAVGNIIDSVFYGKIFSHSYGQLAVLFSDQPYGQWFHGRVVDMIYVPIIEDYPMPEWVPLIGGKNFTFFNAIFNIADVAISIGFMLLLFFNKKMFPEDKKA